VRFYLIVSFSKKIYYLPRPPPPARPPPPIRLPELLPPLGREPKPDERDDEELEPEESLLDVWDEER
jgi:hypothetical protein